MLMGGLVFKIITYPINLVDGLLKKRQQVVQWATRVCLFQKQVSRGVLENSISENFDDIHRKTCDDSGIKISGVLMCLVSFETYKIVKYIF